MTEFADNKRVRVTFVLAGTAGWVDPGDTVRDAAMAAGVYLSSPCGGNGRCGKCLVRVRGPRLPEPTLHERRHLTESDLAAGFRLACQLVVDADVQVERLLPSSREDTSFILTHEGAYDVPVDWDSAVTVDALPEMLRDDDVRDEVRYEGERIAVVLPDEFVCGMAFDVGTTTLAGWLYDLEQGRELAVAAAVNPQEAYGADAVSRIQHASETETGLADLHGAVIGAVNGLAAKMCGDAGVEQHEVMDCTVVGNTVMMHFFLGVSPQKLGLAPYEPAVRGPVLKNAANLGLAMNPGGRVYHLPCIESFIGADTVAVIMATGLNRRPGTHLAIDIGTNGEIVLCHEGRLLACSTAAGPALEGGEMSCGMRGASGAIDSIERTDGIVDIHTIGDGPPVGICGSGILDAVAVLRDFGIINSTGRIVAEEKVDGIDIERVDGEMRVVLDAGKTGDVYLTQRDIRRVQLAKGAVRVGIETLLDIVSISVDDVDTVSFAGAFGNFMRPESAMRVGLLPMFSPDRFRSVGNAAGTGARLALVSRRMREEAVEIATTTEHIDLMTRPGFQDRFAEAMIFPE